MALGASQVVLVGSAGEHVVAHAEEVRVAEAVAAVGSSVLGDSNGAAGATVVVDVSARGWLAAGMAAGQRKLVSLAGRSAKAAPGANRARAQLWTMGVGLAWAGPGVYGRQRVLSAPLPAYAFERHVYGRESRSEELQVVQEVRTGSWCSHCDAGAAAAPALSLRCW